MTIEKKNRLILFWLAITIIFITRIIMIGQVPSDINQDEAFAGYNAYTLLHNGKDSFGYSFPMYLTAWGSGMNALESYLAIPFVAIFGLSTFTIRLVPLITGMFSLAVIYKLIREHAHHDGMAFLGMIFMAIMPWHYMISRWALESNLAPHFLLFGLYFFLKGAKNDKWFLLSALFYGLSLYSYATIWIVVPFIILVQIIYLIYRKMVRFTRYTIGAVLILAVLATPAMLFILVNKDIISEIKTPLLSIPKLVEFRGDELSFSNIPENLENLFNIIFSGSDGLSWNSYGEFGIMYKYTLPFVPIGIFFAFRRPAVNLKKRVNYRIANGKKLDKSKLETTEGIFLPFFILTHLIAGIVVGALISVNINRVNIIFMPLIMFAFYGIYSLFTRIKILRTAFFWLPIFFYVFLFVRFEMVYCTDYKDHIETYHFAGGIEEAMHFVTDELKADSVNITPAASYARVLFFDKTDVNEYLDTVKYTNYPSPFLDVESFGKYHFQFDVDNPPDGHSVYLLNGDYDGSTLIWSMGEAGYQEKQFKNFRVYYPTR